MNAHGLYFRLDSLLLGLRRFDFLPQTEDLSVGFLAVLAKILLLRLEVIELRIDLLCRQRHTLVLLAAIAVLLVTTREIGIGIGLHGVLAVVVAVAVIIYRKAVLPTARWFCLSLSLFAAIRCRGIYGPSIGKLAIQFLPQLFLILDLVEHLAICRFVIFEVFDTLGELLGCVFNTLKFGPVVSKFIVKTQVIRSFSDGYVVRFGADK